jgi:hypothetical protein
VDIGNSMKKKWLVIGVSICAVVLLVLGSLSNVVGYQSVQTSQQSVIKERINQRELLFQTIVDITNNKEIQRIILKSQINRGVFLNPDVKFSLSKNQLRQMFLIGLLLSKFIDKSRMQSMVRKYQLLNPITQEGINGVIEKDVTIRNEITQLQDFKCDCENDNTKDWRFPVICILLFYPYCVTLAIYALYHIFYSLLLILESIILIINCEWYLYSEVNP